MSRILDLGVRAAVGLFLAACDSGTAAPSTTIGVDASQPGTAPSPHDEIAEWIDMTAGHTVSYQMELQCECGAPGKWRIVEQDGEVIEAEYLDEGSHIERPTLLLSGALRRADTADGPVGLSDLSTTSIRLDVDFEVNAIDDEFVFTATGIVIDS